MDSDCCGTIFHLRASHQAEKDGAPEKEIVLRLFQGCPGNIALGMWVSADWLEVKAKLCDVGSSQCEPAAAAGIRPESVSHRDKRASGSFTADFPSTGHQEGKFKVKYHHQGPIPIGE